MNSLEPKFRIPLRIPRIWLFFVGIGDWCGDHEYGGVGMVMMKKVESWIGL